MFIYVTLWFVLLCACDMPLHWFWYFRFHVSWMYCCPLKLSHIHRRRQLERWRQ